MGAETSAFRKGDYLVTPISRDLAAPLIEDFHYAGSMTAIPIYVHGLIRLDDPGTLRGAAVWMLPTKDAAQSVWSGPFTEVLALSRLVLTPDVPSNGESFFIGQSIRLVRKANKYQCLLTYADSWQNHTGIIYKATGWEYMGLTNPLIAYVDPITGKLASNRSSRDYNRRGYSREDMESLGYKCIGHHAKHKFRMRLRPQLDNPARLKV